METGCECRALHFQFIALGSRTLQLSLARLCPRLFYHAPVLELGLQISYLRLLLGNLVDVGAAHILLVGFLSINEFNLLLKLYSAVLYLFLQ